MPPRILIAEDNIVNQRLISMLFQKLGIEPVVAADGLQAFQKASAEKFDIIFMDLHMPEMDGTTAAEQILAGVCDAEPPVIIAMTAGLAPEQEQEIYEAGMKDFLDKPFTLASLQAKLDKWLPVKD